MTNDLSTETIENAVRGRFGRPLRYFDAIGSTNSEALEWADQGAPEGALVVANHQTAGRGRWGRSWLSSPGSLLQFSLVLRPRLQVGSLGLLTTALGVACADVIEALAAIPTTIKWPNDVNVRGRKLAGLLIESKVEEAELDVAIAGVGINVSWLRSDVPAEIAERATSIAIESVRAPSRTDLLAAILASFESLYDMARDPDRAGRVIDRATDRSEILGRDVMIRFPDDTTLEGRAVRLLADGALEFEAGGITRPIHVAEIAQLR
jgi:BirA family transcriptional regulator, biotin operon repressor / biotin---[acetyl-CoA-carboxylase] ligase